MFLEVMKIFIDFQDILPEFPDNNAFTETTAAFIITGTDTESPADGSGFYFKMKLSGIR